MLHLIVVKNPFDAQNSRELHTVESIPGKTIFQYFQPYLMGVPAEEFIYARNGEVIEDPEFVPEDGDYVSAAPFVGKDNWLGQLAMLGLAYFAPGLGEALAGGAGATASLYTMGIMAIGGMLISHLFPQPGLDYDTSTTQSYGWNALETLEGQGKPLAITIGTTRTGGVLIGQHTIKENGLQYLCLLYCGGQGPIDEISDILVNDNPIGNYNDVVVEKRLGNNIQDPISFFQNIYAEQALFFQLKNGGSWSTQQTEGDAGTGLAIVIEFPNGLCRLNDSGDPEDAWVKLNIQFRLENTDGTWGSWADYTSTETLTVTTYRDNGSGGGESGNSLIAEYTYVTEETTNIKITARTKDAFYANFSGSNLPAGRYEVRLKMVDCSPAQDSSRAVMKTYWTTLTHIMQDNLTRPGRVLLGLKIKATDQLSGSKPTVTWIQKRNNAWVKWGDHYEQFPLTNPAVATYDLLHQCRYLQDPRDLSWHYVTTGVNATRIDYRRFAEWYSDCNDLNLQVNGIFNSQSTLWDAIKYISEVGRGSLIPKGTKYSVAWDAPAEPVQMFTVGNIIADSFTEKFVSMDGRANAVEISITNAEKDYQKDPITILAPSWDTADNQDPVAVALPFITSYDQGHREGQYRLNVNQLILRTVEFKASLDAIVCERGDVIRVQNDLTNWGMGGGRLKSIADGTIVLDKPFTFSPATSYGLLISNKNLGHDVITIPQFSTTTTTDTLHIPGFTITGRIAPIDTVYALGLRNYEAKNFRVVALSRSSKLTRKITAVEYVPEVYNTTSVPLYPSLPDASRTVPVITGLRVWTSTERTVFFEHNPSTHPAFSHYKFYFEEIT